MIITINTDASFSNKLKRGAYAFWIVSDKGRIQMSGPIKGTCHDSSDAEMRCIINALHVVSQIPDLNKPGNFVIINTDSMNAIHVLTGNKSAKRRYGLNKKEYINLIYAEFQKVCKRLARDITLDLRHVKSHTGLGDRRSYVNEWCDKTAKEEMGKIIASYLESV